MNHHERDLFVICVHSCSPRFFAAEKSSFGALTGGFRDAAVL
jgi:hypothetical protein